MTAAGSAGSSWAASARCSGPAPAPPRAHPPRRAGHSGRKGAPGQRVGLWLLLLCPRGLPHPDAERQTQQPRAKPSSAPAGGPRRQPPDPRSLPDPPHPPPEEPGAAHGAASPHGTVFDPLLDGGTAWPQIHASTPASDAKPSPQPQRSAPAARLPSNSGSQTAAPHLRPRTAGMNAACSPSLEPSERTRRPPLCDRPRLVARRGWLPEENRAGCPAGHPRPPISGGDPSGAGPRGGGSQLGGVGGPSRCSAGPARRASGRHRPTVTRSPRTGPPRAPLSVQRGDSHPRLQLTSRGGAVRKSSNSPETLCPRWRRRLCFPGLEEPRPSHRIPHAPALGLSRILHYAEEKKKQNPSPLCVGSLPRGRRSSKETRALI